MKLHHVAVVCASQENADRFYGEGLGLEKIKTQTLGTNLSEQIFGISSECGMILYGRKDLAIEVFIPLEAPKKPRPFGHLCLAVKDRDALLDRCGAAGLAVKKIPKGNSLVVFVEDFDGNLFEVKELPG
jgi:catechol 2,3-dioxygenase-like lactoylglutathione lyase family enzyme